MQPPLVQDAIFSVLGTREGLPLASYHGGINNATAAQGTHHSAYGAHPNLRDKVVAYSSIAFGIIGFFAFLGYYLTPLVRYHRTKKAAHRRKELLQELQLSESTPKSHRNSFVTRGDRSLISHPCKDTIDMDVSPISPETPVRVHLSRKVKADHMLTRLICTPPSPSPARSYSVTRRSPDHGITASADTPASASSFCRSMSSESKQLANVLQQTHDSELPYLSYPSQGNALSQEPPTSPSILVSIFPPPRSSSLRFYSKDKLNLFEEKV